MGYRISTDRGTTRSQEMIALNEFGGGQCSGALRNGGVNVAATAARRPWDYFILVTT